MTTKLDLEHSNLNAIHVDRGGITIKVTFEWIGPPSINCSINHNNAADRAKNGHDISLFLIPRE